MLDTSTASSRAVPTTRIKNGTTKVLVVDDTALILYRIAYSVAQAGYQCIEATDGLEAVQAYKRERPSAVFLDASMPVMDGLTALKAIKEFDPEARVTMVTAMGERAMVEKALAAGATDFVVKPFNGERLLAALARMLE